MKFYTTKEIAEILQVHIITVRRYIHSGKLKAVKIGKEYRITEEEFNRFVKGE